MELLNLPTLSQDTLDLLSVLIGLCLVGYYVDLITRVTDKTCQFKKPTKKQFLIGLIPLTFWIMILATEVSELD